MTLNPQRILLAVIILLYLALAALYAVETPKWQAPDEPAHFNYIRTIGDTGTLPILQPGDYNQDYLEKIKAAKFPADMPVDSIRYESYQPPLYYLAAMPVYLAARSFGLDAQVIALRLFSVAVEAIVLLLAFAIIRSVFPSEPLLVFATVGAMATIPMHIAVTASISNDAAAELIVALVLLLAVKRIQCQVSDRRFIILGGILFGAALLTKSTTYVTCALLLVGAEFGHWFQVSGFRFSPIPRETEGQGSGSTQYRAASPLDAARDTRYAVRNTQSVSPITDYISRTVSTLIPLFLIALALSSPMFIRNMLTYGVTDPLGMGRHDSIVIGQPTTAQVIADNGIKHVAFDFFATTFRSFWAQFGWMGVLVDDRIYTALAILTGVALFGFALYAFRIVRHRELFTPPQHWAFGLFLLLAAVGLADYVGYQFKFYQLQGRYLFPALVPIAFFLVVGLREILSPRYQRLLFALLYTALMGLDFACLFLYIIPQLKM